MTADSGFGRVSTETTLVLAARTQSPRLWPLSRFRMVTRAMDGVLSTGVSRGIDEENHWLHGLGTGGLTWSFRHPSPDRATVDEFTVISRDRDFRITSPSPAQA